MNKKQFIRKSLICGIFLLSTVNVFSTALSRNIPISNFEITRSNNQSDDSDFLASMRMDFGEGIYNDEIECIENVIIPIGEYYVHVVMDYNCPLKSKIEINYLYSANLTYIYYPETRLDFCKKSGSITITNGSNPPTFSIKYEKYLEEFYWWVMKLHINATLKVYEFVNGEWIQIDKDYTDRKVEKIIHVSNSISSDTNIPAIKYFERTLYLLPKMRMFSGVQDNFIQNKIYENMGKE